MASASKLAQLKFYLSGGSSNSDPTASHGGAISTTQVLNEVATNSTSPTPGVTLGDAWGNKVGSGTLTYTYSATAPTLQWTPPQGAIGTAVDVSTDGEYDLQGSNDGGGVTVTVVAASHPGASRTEAIAITMQDQKIFDDITKAESKAGRTDYRCIALKNNGTVVGTDEKVDVEIYIASNTSGLDNISLGLAAESPSTGAGSAGVDYPTDTGSETGAPSGVTFSSPTSTSPLTAFDLSSTGGSTYVKFLWIKREIPAGSYTETTGNTFQIGIKVKA